MSHPYQSRYDFDLHKYVHPTKHMGKITDYFDIKENSADHEVKMLMSMMKHRIPFSLSRFNDGEMGGIQRVGASIARGDQIVDNSLHNKLIECIKHEQTNYFVGMPCKTCFSHMRDTADSLVRSDYPYKIRACCITNRNWLYFIQNFKDSLDGRKLNWVGGDDQKFDVFDDWGIELDFKAHVPRQNSWSVYEDILPMVNKFKDGDVIGLSCGPLSRILAKEWFEANPTLTVIDIGSGTDPFTRPKWEDCHIGWPETGHCITARCPECN